MGEICLNRRAWHRRDAGRYRCRKCHHGGPKRRPVGISTLDAATGPGADSFHRAGAHSSPGHRFRERPRRLDPSVFWPWLGFAIGRHIGCSLHRCSPERAERPCRCRTTVRHTDNLDDDGHSCRVNPHGLYRVLPVSRAHRIIHRRFRAGVPSGGVARASQCQCHAV